MDIDDICRRVVAKQHPHSPSCPYGRKPTFDDMWEIDKDRLRKQVRSITEEVTRDLHHSLGLDRPWIARG